MLCQLNDSRLCRTLNSCPYTFRTGGLAKSFAKSVHFPVRLSAPCERNEAIAIEACRMQVFADPTIQESLEVQANRFHVVCTFH
jgi:hypothetical protein